MSYIRFTENLLTDTAYQNIKSALIGGTLTQLDEYFSGNLRQFAKDPIFLRLTKQTNPNDYSGDVFVGGLGPHSEIKEINHVDGNIIEKILKNDDVLGIILVDASNKPFTGFFKNAYYNYNEEKTKISFVVDEYHGRYAKYAKGTTTALSAPSFPYSWYTNDDIKNTFKAYIFHVDKSIISKKETRLNQQANALGLMKRREILSTFSRDLQLRLKKFKFRNLPSNETKEDIAANIKTAIPKFLKYKDLIYQMGDHGYIDVGTLIFSGKTEFNVIYYIQQDSRKKYDELKQEMGFDTWEDAPELPSRISCTFKLQGMSIIPMDVTFNP